MKKKTIFRLGILLLMLMNAPHLFSQATYVPTILGGVVKANSWTMDNMQEGIYELRVGDELTLTKITEGRQKAIAPLGGAVYDNGVMHGIHFTQYYDAFDGVNAYNIYHVAYDMDTWEQTLSKFIPESKDRNLISSCGIAHNPVTGKNYGIFYNFDLYWHPINRKLASIDFSGDYPTREVVDQISEDFVAIAFSNIGLLYGIDREGDFYYIDAGDGTVLYIGATGVTNLSYDPMSACFDPKTGKMYWCAVDKAYKSRLYEVNATTGVATLIGDMPDNAEMVNMYIAAPEAVDAAPAAVTDLAASFEGDATEGIVSFTAPTTSYLGDPLTGTMDYEVKANGTVIATGTVAAGEATSVNVAVEAGDNEIVVTVSNSAGTSPEAKISVYVGPDTPLAPEDVCLNYDDATKTVSLTWTMPLVGVQGKAIDPAALTYRITRMDDGVVVAEGHTGDTFEETFDPATLAPYYYKVEAIHHGMTGEAASSNKMPIGPALEIPYSQTFATAASLDLFTIIDNNHDGKTWTWEKSFSSGNGRAIYLGSNENQADDWLLTPPLHLYADAKYQLNFDALSVYPVYVEQLVVALGKGVDISGYHPLADEILISQAYELPVEISDITVEEDGVYHFAFKAQSYRRQGELAIDNITVKMTQEPTSITAVEGVPAEGPLSIYTADGRCVYQSEDAATIGKQLPAGFYIVKQGKKSTKIVVK